MNSKQECISKAYGKYWEELKDCVDENGWHNIHKAKIKFKDYYYVQEFENKGNYYRPKSLQGIENNRGWIKIESEESLPTKEGKYIWGRLHKESEYGPEWFEKFKETTKEGIIKAYKFYIGVTHYKEVFEHEPPLH